MTRTASRGTPALMRQLQSETLIIFIWRISLKKKLRRKSDNREILERTAAARATSCDTVGTTEQLRMWLICDVHYVFKVL